MKLVEFISKKNIYNAVETDSKKIFLENFEDFSYRGFK